MPLLVAHVAEDHHLDVDGGAQVVADVGGVAIVDGALAEPTVEDGAGGQFQLLVGVLREVTVGVRLDDALETFGDDLPLFGVQFDVDS